MSLRTGAFVSIPGHNKGLAKIISIDTDTANIEWFVSIARHQTNPLKEQVPLMRLQSASPPIQTRCYVEMSDGVWAVGRITSDVTTPDSNQQQMLRVKIGGESEDWFPEDRVWVRCLRAAGNPVETIATGAQDTPYFHPHRNAFLRSYLTQRGAAAGLTGLLSSRINLLNHQVHVVRRVLEDPVCRYLLADEVGLGKTIEAGIIARQLRIDKPSARILVVVPSALKKQWKNELEDKFLLNVDGEHLVLLSMQEVVETPVESKGFELVIFDEAHHIGAAHRDKDKAQLWSKCRELAHAASRLLLLSATPAFGHEADFAAMLHLLEPTTYDLDDLNSFRRRVEDRQEVGQFLLSFNTPLLRVSARRAVPRLRALFADDPAITQATDELERLVNMSAKPDPSDPLTLWQQEEADRLARLLRIRICETYRLHRRMARTSRRTLERDGSLSAIEIGKRLGATPEWDFDSRLEALHDALESWREAARWHISRLPDEEMEGRTAALAEVYATLWTCSGTWHHLLRLSIECRLGNDDDYSDALGEAEQNALRVPLFYGEEEALQALNEVLDTFPSTSTDEPRDALEVALSLVAQEWKANASAKVLLFTSSRLAAQRIAQRLEQTSTWNAGVWTHLETQSEARRDASLGAFVLHKGPGVLICDRSGEEGLNLQFATALILFDLPPDPNRLEQRLGRLDRIGHAHDLRPRVFMGWSGERAFGSPSPSIHEAWFRVLNDGLGLFNGSVADLGFVIETMVPRLKQIAFELGPQGLIDEVPTIVEEVKVERVKIREQSELDETEAFARDDDAFFERLITHDKDGEPLREGIHGWMCKAWQFVTDSRMDRPRVRFAANDRTLVPRDWRERLLNAQDAVPATWDKPVGGCTNRALSCKSSSTQLLRPGSGLLDELYRLSLWDDRGQAFALWRATPLWAEDEAGIFFRFDFLIEADTKPVERVLNELKASGWDSGGLRALMRQAESWLPPQWKSYVFDIRGQYVSDPKILELITPNYKHFAESQDYNLDAERLWALDQLVSSDTWKKLCPQIAGCATKFVRQVPTLQQTWRRNAEKAKQEGERRLELVRRGMLHGAAYSAGPVRVEELEEQLAQEKRLGDALCQGIAHPSVRIDAAGVYVLSRNNPFADGHKNTIPVLQPRAIKSEAELVDNASEQMRPSGIEQPTLPFDLFSSAPASDPVAVVVDEAKEQAFAARVNLLLDMAIEKSVITSRKRDSLFSYYKSIYTGQTAHRFNGDAPLIVDLLRRSLAAKGLKL